MTLVTTVFMYAVIILYTRVFGLRSFSKMSAFDFAMTVAIGSLFAGALSSPSPSLLLSAVTLGGLFAGQKVIALGRQKAWLRDAVDNDPILLMANGKPIENNLRFANVTDGDLTAKLREANVLHFGQVKAVVMESTGDISVLHGEPDDEFNPALLEGVRDADKYFGQTTAARSD